jgi:O-antigen biosynthesis protein WbqP
MVKLRTMKTDTPLIPAKFLIMPEQYFNCFGKILRNTGIDELPQLYNILKGDMSFVGPRPVISSETELIEMRTEKGINLIKPGLTGLAQIKGRDKLSIHSKIKYDEIYMNNFGFLMDFKIILLTNYWLFYENIYCRRLILKEKFNLNFVKDILF